MRTRAAIVCFAASLALPSVSPAEVVLVEQGRPQAVIVVADQPSPAARLAAQLLTHTLAEISGGELPVVAEKNLGALGVQEGRLTAAGRPEQAFVLLGRSAAAAKLGLSADGFRPGEIQIATRPNALVLLGADDKTPADPRGTLYATLVFLEEQLGCRWLWPGPEGRVIPRRATIALPDVQYRFAPPIVQRGIRFGGYSDRIQAGLDKLGLTKQQFDENWKRVSGRNYDLGWPEWQRLGGSLQLRAGHAFGDYWERFGREHPEWFALQPNGSRDQSRSASRPRLCKTNPALLDQIARDKIEELNQQTGPGPKSVSICPNDGGVTTFCTCPECKKLDPPEGRKIELLFDDPSGGRVQRKFFDYVSLTDRMVAFYNAIAERVTRVHPDALLVADAYSAYSAPPLHGKLHPNVVIRFVPGTWTKETERAEARADWDAWSQAAAKIYYRPNGLLATRRTGTLCFFPHRLGEDLEHLVATGLIATDFDSCTQSWAVDGLNFYVTARLLWNPKLSVDEIIADFCRTGFGAAAEPVERYVRKVEQLTDDMARREVPLIEPYTPAVAAELRAMLDEADRRAAGDGPVEARLAFLRAGFDFTALQAEAHALLTADPRPAKQQVVELLERRKALMRQIFTQWPLAVNVCMVAWGEGHPWSELGWTWQTPKR